MNDQSKEAVAARLKSARQRIFATASEAAEALTMNPVTVRAHESGRNGVSYYDLERYARRYGVAQMWLLTGQGREEPSAEYRSELGELLYVEGVIDDETWYDSGEGFEPFSRTEEGYAERVAYTDPRYPEGMVGAFRVRTRSPDQHYINGTIIFCVDRTEFPIGKGDHVLVIRTRGDFDNLSARVVDEDADGMMLLRSLTSSSPPIRMEETDKEELPHISALIVGSLVRRPAPAITRDQIRRWEGNVKQHRKHEEQTVVRVPAYLAHTDDDTKDIG